jgi:polynucleotide 5'-kinase involved in rRNA processing
LNLTDEETTDVQAEMAETLTFNASVPSDGLQGRSNPLHKWLDGGDEAGRRLRYVLLGPGGVGKSTLALKLVAAASGCGWCSGYRLCASESSKLKIPNPPQSQTPPDS